MPALLLPDDDKLHGVPLLPANFMPRPEQADLRTALIEGDRHKGTVLGIVGTSPFNPPPGGAGTSRTVGLAGTAGIMSARCAPKPAHCCHSFLAPSSDFPVRLASPPVPSPPSLPSTAPDLLKLAEKEGGTPHPYGRPWEDDDRDVVGTRRACTKLLQGRHLLA